MSGVGVADLLDALAGLDPWVILLAVGALALLENAAFAGLVVPGEAAVLVAGALVRRDAVDALPLLVAVFAGAVAGDSIGYSIGRRLFPRLGGGRAERLLGSRRITAGIEYMRRRGARAVFFGRFVAVVRTVVPLLAGASRVPYRTFLFWNAAGAAVWASTHIAAGYAAASSLERLDSTISTIGLVVGVVVLLAVVRRRPTVHRVEGTADLLQETGSHVSRPV